MIPHEGFPVTVVAIPLYFALMAWEIRRVRRLLAAGDDTIGYEGRDTRASLTMGLGSLGSDVALAIVEIPLAHWLWDHRLWTVPGGLTAALVGMLLVDFSYYWFHRTEHEVRFFWAQHVVHHSSQHYNLSTALRQPWLPLAHVAFIPTLTFFGLSPWTVFTCYGANLVYQYWVHTEAVDRMPRWFEAVLNTPSHHRVHHGSNRQYLDRNHAGILIIWDKLFGTFEPEGERVVYGLTKNIATFHPIEIATHEYAEIWRDVRAAARLGDKVGHVLRGPGWRPSLGIEPVSV